MPLKWLMKTLFKLRVIQSAQVLVAFHRISHHIQLTTRYQTLDLIKTSSIANIMRMKLLVNFMHLGTKLESQLRLLKPLNLLLLKLLMSNLNLIQTATLSNASPTILSGKKRRKLLTTQFQQRTLWTTIWKWPKLTSLLLRLPWRRNGLTSLLTLDTTSLALTSKTWLIPNGERTGDNIDTTSGITIRTFQPRGDKEPGFTIKWWITGEPINTELLILVSLDLIII